MTHVYQWFALPPVLAVVCPKCNGEAVHRRAASDQVEALVGTLTCIDCHYHALDVSISWPSSAYFQCSVRGAVLWACSREHAISTRDFLLSKSRDPKEYPGCMSALLHIPKHFLTAKNRLAATKAIDKMLA